ncbi:MAG TPA: PEP/pyruvate-binding domain-containing protein [Myxococcales bacterium]|jgi:pyruvate,water dikinase
METATILPLEKAASALAGGKATGLAKLLELGFRVPPGFVIIGGKPGELAEEALKAYRALGGKVAVRSSALGEDGEQASFAGQYESVLNVEGELAFRKAVDHCLNSLHSPRAASYRTGGMATPGAKQMAVVVQRMVDAQAAGVLFTLDPISGRKDRMAVDAVKGLGEALVSGRATPDHYALSRDGKAVRTELAGSEAVLSEAQLAELVARAKQAEEGFGKPLDMEWAFDAKGELYWLQARPITVAAGDLHELDSCPGADHVYTTANIGEMLSGANCPLTLSVTGYGIDYGSQVMWHAAGTHPEVKKELTWIGIFNGHMFIDMIAFMPFNCGVAGASPEVACTTIVGEVVPEVVARAQKVSGFRRAVNGYRFARYLLRGEKCMREHEAAITRFSIPTPESAQESWAEIDRALPFLWETYKVHLQVSSGAAVMAGVLEGMLAKNPGTAAEKEALMSGMLAHAGEVISAKLIRELEEVLDHLEQIPDVEQRFLEADATEALAWLMGADSGRAGGAFRNYLGRWGHRAYRELDLQERGWGEEPLPLALSLRASLVGRRRTKARPTKLETHPPVKAKAEPPKPKSGSIRWALEKAKKGVVGREYTKNMLVTVNDRFKKAYRQLGARMAAEGLLAAEDDVFFFSHPELGRIARGEDAELSKRAAPRRDALQRQQAYEYPVVSIGIPEPLSQELPSESIAGELRGKPVSPGVATGRVRVAHSADASAALQPGEILVAPSADVGWTPYFNLIAGLVTEVGSAFCHGAVVAREYGLPTVVNVKSATKTLKTGDWVLLDADHGVVRRLTPDEVVAAETQEKAKNAKPGTAQATAA